MITYVLNIFYSFLSTLISALPAGSGFPSGVHTATSALAGYLHILDPLVPISTLLTCVGLVVGAELALFTFRTLKWLISHIPYFGGHK